MWVHTTCPISFMAWKCVLYWTSWQDSLPQYSGSVSVFALTLYLSLLDFVSVFARLFLCLCSTPSLSLLDLVSDRLCLCSTLSLLDPLSARLSLIDTVCAFARICLCSTVCVCLSLCLSVYLCVRACLRIWLACTRSVVKLLLKAGKILHGNNENNP